MDGKKGQEGQEGQRFTLLRVEIAELTARRLMERGLTAEDIRCLLQLWIEKCLAEEDTKGGGGRSVLGTVAGFDMMAATGDADFITFLELELWRERALQKP